MSRWSLDLRWAPALTALALEGAADERSALAELARLEAAAGLGGRLLLWITGSELRFAALTADGERVGEATPVSESSAEDCHRRAASWLVASALPRARAAVAAARWRALSASGALEGDELGALRARLTEVRAELEETNLGVVALYSQKEQEDQLKDRFIATLGHELRNPLAVIGHALELLPPLPELEEATHPRAMIRRQVAVLQRHVADLLDSARIRRGKIELRRERIDLARTVRLIAADHRPQLERAGMRLETDLAEAIWVDADPTRIDQVLTNLLDNAAKYSPPDTCVTLELRREGPQALLAVSDQGPGMTAAQRAHAFEVFWQEDQALQGLGLGLPLVKDLIELHGGDVSIPETAAGTRVELRLPRVEPPEAASPQPQQPADGLTDIQLLLADDNDDLRGLLAIHLERRGARVSQVADGDAALDLIEASRPALALLDIDLPGRDGFEIARLVRQRELPVGLIAMTGFGDRASEQRGREAGFDRYLVKPVPLARLIEVILEVARERKAL